LHIFQVHAKAAALKDNRQGLKIVAPMSGRAMTADVFDINLGLMHYRF
jgi:hypothetical protein